ncbi:hypothetical protein LCI18_012975 [Fusarium solani-melongenae]|uniref:Uncharacterized protein n=1 Tax=Fusarium solani subsp. cucurbitae TaxID=2747967 RepID=A0ACD3ZLR9_FUSSC|nr:hypothetical protein LCI18_012975 [Fusarium solani-melongenae]
MASKKHTNPSDLPLVNRFITAHNDQGKSIFSRDLAEPLEFWEIASGTGKVARFELGYTTQGFPVQLMGDKDLTGFKESYAKKESSGLVRQGGTILRYVDIPPGCDSPMHRTVSLDYGIVVSGEVECLLDSGESRTARPGDLVVQRGTMHQWINKTDRWARIVFILFHAEPIIVGGKHLGEDRAGMGLPDSH